MNTSTTSLILWIVAGTLLVLYLLRRRDRKHRLKKYKASLSRVIEGQQN